VGPAEGQDYGVPGTAAVSHLLVGRISVALQDTAVAGEQHPRMLGAAPRRVGVDNGRWAGAAVPGAVVAGNRPEVPGLRAPAAGIEHRSASLIDKQPRRAEQDLTQVPPQRHQLGRGITDPERQHRAVDLDSLRQQDLGLPVEGQVPGVFADQHIRDHGLGRQAGADQALRRRGLDDGAGARAATVFWASRDENAVLRRDDVEPLRFLLAQDMHAPPQHGHEVVSGSITTSTRGRWAGSDLRTPGADFRVRRRRLLFRRRLFLRSRNLAFFEGELQLVGVEPLGVPTEPCPLELPDNVVHPLDAMEQLVALGD